MDELNIHEAALFLLLLSANFEWDPITNSIQDELPPEAEQFIFKCFGFPLFRQFNEQKKLEEAIGIYNDLKDFSSTTAEIIQHCAKPLIPDTDARDMTYYLCSRIVNLNGLVQQDSKGDKYLSKLSYYLKVDPVYTGAVFFIGLLDNALKSQD